MSSSMNLIDRYQILILEEKVNKDDKIALDYIRCEMTFIENAFLGNGLDVQKEIIEFNDRYRNWDYAKYVKFISYNGEYPTLCCGVLTVKIMGQVEKFKDCLKSRELTVFENNERYPMQGNWVFDPKFNINTKPDFEQNEFEFAYFRKQARKIIKEGFRLEIERLVNECLVQCCCCGCD